MITMKIMTVIFVGVIVFIKLDPINPMVQLTNAVSAIEEMHSTPDELPSTPEELLRLVEWTERLHERLEAYKDTLAYRMESLLYYEENGHFKKGTGQ